MNKKSLTVLWPDSKALDVEEIRFSISFCRKKSEALCSESEMEIIWIDYSPGASMSEILKGLETDFLLLVSDPEIILSSQAVLAMVQSSESEFAAIGPVYNLTSYQEQLAELPAPYLNTTTFDEILTYNFKNENAKPISTGLLDPGCILYPTGFLKTLTVEQLMEVATDLSKVKIAKEICRKALVHRYGNYYDGERTDLVALIPDKVKTILDVGTAMGGYGKGLKKARPEVTITGVEMNQLMAKKAERFYNRMFIGKVEDFQLKDQFDLINCGDVLEHLYDPWKMVERLGQLVNPGGYLVLSVPNAGHWSIVSDLLNGKFEYIPVGIQCITHIRWFTEESIRAMLEKSGFKIEVFQRQQIPPTPEGEKFIRKMKKNKYGNEQSLLTYEFIIRAIKK